MHEAGGTGKVSRPVSFPCGRHRCVFACDLRNWNGPITKLPTQPIIESFIIFGLLQSSYTDACLQEVPAIWDNVLRVLEDN